MAPAAGRDAWARIGAVVAVGSIVVGWGVAQYPWILVDEVEIAAVTVVPALVYLLWLTQPEAWAATDHADSNP